MSPGSALGGAARSLGSDQGVLGSPTPTPTPSRVLSTPRQRGSDLPQGRWSPRFRVAVLKRQPQKPAPPRVSGPSKLLAKRFLIKNARLDSNRQREGRRSTHRGRSELCPRRGSAERRGAAASAHPLPRWRLSLRLREFREQEGRGVATHGCPREGRTRVDLGCFFSFRALTAAAWTPPALGPEAFKGLATVDATVRSVLLGSGQFSKERLSPCLGWLPRCLRGH